MTTPKTHSLEELLGKQYSEALLQMDRNTVNYMIEDMKKELAEKDHALAEKDHALAEKDALIEELKRKLEQNIN